jgi:cytochrome c oxidase subunit II
MGRSAPLTVIAVCSAAGVVAVAGCGGDQSVLDPGGDQASEIATVWWIMLILSALIFGVVLALVLIAVLRKRGAKPTEDRSGGGGTRLVLVGGLVVPGVVLTVLFVLILASLGNEQEVSAQETLAIDVTGRQWFWDVRYPSHGVKTANEIHVPTGRPVKLRVTTNDVIHSLWVPSLARKIDMIPGQANSVVFEVDEPGVYPGQCAEFCGLQHARMGFLVVAQDPPEFERWLEAQRLPAPEPDTALGREGQQIFLGSACSYCHRVAGTNASGELGPDLTHLASRRTLGARTIPNDRGRLAGWVLDPQHFKPGNKMPGTDLDGRELQALLEYLESLR